MLIDFSSLPEQFNIGTRLVTNPDQQAFMDDLREAFQEYHREGFQSVQVEFSTTAIGTRLHYSALVAGVHIAGNAPVSD